MKTGYRPTSYRLFRTGEAGLKTILRIVDRAIEVAKDVQGEAAREVCLSGLPDLKMRLNRELRDNAAFEMKHRRESFEMEDLELASKRDIGYLRKVHERIEGQLRTLMQLDELQTLLGSRPIPTESATPLASLDNGPGPTDSSEEPSNAIGDGQDPEDIGPISEAP